MGMGLGLCCCKPPPCQGLPFNIPILNGNVVPGLHFVQVNLDQTGGPPPPWPPTTGNAGPQWRLLTFTGVTNGLLRFERPAVAVATDGVEVVVNLDPAPASFPNPARPCLQCHYPVDMTVRHPSITGGEAKWEFVFDTIPSFFQPCGQGHWESTDIDHCPDGILTATSPKIFRTADVASKQFRVTVSGVVIPEAFCTQFNRTYDLDIFDPIGDPENNVDGWHTAGGFWEHVSSFGPGDLLTATFEFTLPQATLTTAPVVGGSPCLNDPWEPDGAPPDLFSDFFEEVGPDVSECSTLHQFVNGAVSKTSLLDSNWADLVYDFTFFPCDLDCGNAEAALQNLTFVEL